MMIKNSAHMMRALALITIVTLSFLAPAHAAIGIDGDGSDWQTGYYQIQDGENDIGASFNSGYEMTCLWLYYETNKLYLRIDVKGVPGDADGDGSPDTALPTDQPGVGINEIYRFRIDTNLDGVWDITIVYSNNTLTPYGISADKVAFAYGKVVEASIADISSLGINPYSFRIDAYAGTSLDGLPEDTVPATDVNLSPSLQLQKGVDKQEAQPGDILTYTLSYSNTGFSDATNVSLQDSIPTDTVYVSGGTLAGNIVIWNIGTLKVGQSSSATLKVKINTPLNNNTIIRNSATMTSNQTVPKTSDAETVVHSSPILSIEKTDSPDPVSINSNLTYTITYANRGNMNATNIVIIDQYPQNVTFVSAAPPPTSGNNEWRMGSLAAGASGSITVTVKVGNVLEGTVLTNKASITSDQTPVTDTTTTTKVSSVLLSLTKSDSPDPVNAGQNLTYILSYSNTGSMNATNVVITENYDSNLTFLSSVPQPDAGTTNKFTIGNLAAGASGTVTVVVKVSPSVANGTTVTNTATISSSQTEPVSATETTTVLSKPLLSIEKVVDKAQAKPSETLTYTITIKNSGTANATGVIVSDALPLSTTLVSNSTTEGGNGTGTIVWNIGTLTPNQTKILGFKAKVGGDFTGTITNIATLDSDQTDPQSDDAIAVVNNSIIVDILLSPLSQSKQVGKCETAVFPITVLNRGSMGDTIDISFPPPPSGWNASLDRQQVVLDPGASTIIYLSVNACMDAGQVTIGVTGRSGNNTSVTSSVSTVTLIKKEETPLPNNQTSSDNTMASKARQDLIIINVQSGQTFFLKNSMMVNSMELTGPSIVLQVDVCNRGIRTAHDVTPSFKDFKSYIVQPAKQDIAGGKTVSYNVTLTFSEFPTSLFIFADGREDDSGAYKLKIKPPPPVPEPAVVRPVLTVTPVPEPAQSPIPTLPPQTPQSTLAPTIQSIVQTPSPIQSPTFFETFKRKTSDSFKAAVTIAKSAAPYAGASFALVCILALIYATRRKMADVISFMIAALKRIRMPKIIPERRPRPTPARPARHGIPGRKHKFVLETEGF